MSRRGPPSDYDDRRDYRSSRSRYDDRDHYDDYRRGPPPREREREVLVREEVRERDRRDGPAYLRDDYGRSQAGPMVLRKRETEEFEVIERPPRPPSPEPELKSMKKDVKEEIIIKRDESEHRVPDRRRGGSRDREEIIIRRTEDHDDDVRSIAPSRRGGDREKEEIIIRRTEQDDDVRSRRGGLEREKEEIIIRRTEQDDDVRSRRGGRSDIGRHDTRPISHERERSRVRGRGGESDSEEIIIRNEDRGHGDKQQEIIIRRHSRSPSPSTISTRRRSPPPIHAPPIHQEIITHHRHIDHGYELGPSRRPVSRPPTPPSPPRPRERSEERIEIRRSGERNGEHYSEDIIIDRQESDTPRERERRRDPIYDDYVPPAARQPPPGYLPGALAPYRPGGYDRDVAEEAELYNDVAMRRGYPGEAYHGATRDWGIVDVPPGTRRVRMDGAGGGEQEISWTRYGGVRRSRFEPDGGRSPAPGGYYPPPGGELVRPEPPGTVGPQYRGRRDPTDGLWTEITKDLVVKEAIREMGYEFEETDDFFYIIAYLRYEDVARLVGLSDDIRKQRGQRVREIGWENRVVPPPLIEPRPRPAIEGPPGREREHERTWDREDERYIEREVVYRGGRPPPPVGWRR